MQETIGKEVIDVLELHLRASNDRLFCITIDFPTTFPPNYIYIYAQVPQGHAKVQTFVYKPL